MANKIGEPTMATMINNLPGFIYRCANDPNWTMIYISEGCQQITGYTPDDLIDNKTLAFNDIIHPDYQQHLWETWQILLEKRGVFEEEYSIINASGEIRWVWERGRGVFSSIGELLFLEGFITDITERRKAQENLKESEARYRKIFENIQDVFYQVDSRGLISDISPSIFKYSGYTREELIGKPVEEVYYAPKDRQKLLEELQRNGEVADYDVRLKTKEGQKKWASLNVHLVFNATGSPAGMEGSLRDVSQRKLAEEDLKRSEEKLRTFFEESPIGIEIYDANGIQVAANKSSYYMFGIQNNSSSGFNLFEGTSLNEELKSKLLKGDPVHYEHSFDFDRVRELNQYQTSRIGKAEMAYLITPFKSDGSSTIQGYILQVQDITERKHSEQLHKVLYNISNAVAITTDLEELVGKIQVELGTLVDTANFYVALYDEHTELLSTPFYKDEVDEMASWPAEKSITGYVIKTGKSLLGTTEKIQQLCDEGEIKIVGIPAVIWLGVPLFMEGKAAGALAVQSYTDPNAYSQKDAEILEFVSHQISLSIQRKKAEQDLVEALEKAQESDLLKSAFLANMSHEIRTPMNAILGFTELLGQNEHSVEEQEHFTGIIRNAGKKLMRLIDDIIDISKLEARQITISPSSCDVVKLLITTVESYHAMDLLKKKPGVHLQLVIPPATSIPGIETDPYRLQQILDNLVTNAIKFTDQGSIEIGITPMASENIKFLEFYVKDTGKGIPAEKLNIIFERFRQVEGDSYRQGAGLGLSISKALIELLGGELWVVSEFGKGTTFYFTIPFRPVLPGEQTTTQLPPEKSLDLSGKLIYIAEDEDDGFDYIALLLKDTHAIIRRANNGDLLLNMIREKVPDLLLLDINMPGKTGYECLSEIQDAGFKIRIIAQTAYAMADEKRRCIEAGCHGYLAKPYTKKGLIESIGNVLK